MKFLIKEAKHNKDRWISGPKNYQEAIKEYLEKQRPKTKEPYLFVLPDGRKLTRDRILKRIKALLKKAGMEGLMHSFRRGCFTHYASKGVPLPHLQIISGHSDIRTLQGYIRPDVEEVLRGQSEW
jgi:integrase/recombinase XerD